MLAYTRYGQGQTLVLLHYFGGSGRTWLPVMERVSDTFDCIAPDLRGWGDSQGDYQSFTVDDMADDVSELLSSLGIGSYALAGHSMGGKVAMALAVRHPAGLSRLLLAAPSPLLPEPMTDDERAQLRAAWGNLAEYRRMLAQITAHPLPAVLADDVLADNTRASQVAWQAWPDTGSREDLGDRYAQITVPTFVLAGEQDDPLSPEYLQTHVVSRIHGAALQTVPDTAHLLVLEDVTSVADFLHAHGRE